MSDTLLHVTCIASMHFALNLWMIHITEQW